MQADPDREWSGVDLSLSRAPIRRYVTSLVCEVQCISSFQCSSYINTPRAEYEEKIRCRMRDVTLESLINLQF